MNRRHLLLALLVLLLAEQEHQEHMGMLVAQLQALNVSVLCMAGSVAGLATLHGFRRQLGTAFVFHQDVYATVLRMADENPQQFYRNFRMLPDTFYWFRDELWEHTHPAAGASNRPHRPPSKDAFTRRLLMTIWYLGNGCSFTAVSFAWGMWASFDTLLIREVAWMAERFVRWPIDAEFAGIAAGFGRLRGFHQCGGAIDGTFIKIQSPLKQAQDPNEFNTYKKFYAIQLLAVCTASLLFTFVYTGVPGSRADSWIVAQTPLYQHYDQFLPEGSYLFGDSGFALLTWLMTPFTKKQLHSTHGAANRKLRKRYNDDQASTRVCIEQAFGVLKGRWQCLRTGLRCRLRNAGTHVMACVVLHNVCIARSDVWKEFDPSAPGADPDR
eukprot:6190884-Prymnesium_polylepis.1